MLRIAPSLRRTAERIISQVLRIKPSETVLVLTNPGCELEKIALAMVAASYNAGARPNLLFQSPKTSEDFMEPQVLEAFKQQPDIFIGVSKKSTGADAEGTRQPYRGVTGHLAKHDIRFYLFEKKYMRGFWTSGLRVRDFVRLNAVDHEEIGVLGRKLYQRLQKARQIVIKTGQAERLEIDISKLHPFSDDAQYHRPGLYGNLPSGEVFYSPVPGKTNGSILLDGVLATLSGTIQPRQPVRVVFRDGRAVKVEGGAAADQLRDNFIRIEQRIKTLVKEKRLKKSEEKEYRQNITAIGEVGIGINRQAKIYPGVGLMEAEKVYGTMHIAFGLDYDGQIKALNHQDCVTMQPETWLVYGDGRNEKILANRRFCFKKRR